MKGREWNGRRKLGWNELGWTFREGKERGREEGVEEVEKPKKMMIERSKKRENETKKSGWMVTWRKRELL